MNKPFVVPSLHSAAAAAALLAAPLLLAACGAVTGDGSGGDAGSGPRVVASFYPLQYVAERVAGDHAQVMNLTAPGVEPHDLELSVRQTAEVDRADVALYVAGFQPAVDDTVAQSEPESVVEVGEEVDLVSGDPHFWLDPARMAEVGAAFAAALGDVDPEHAEDYTTNAADLRTDLEDLDRDYAERLAACDLDTVVVSHDAFGYLEKYGLRFEAIAGLSPDAEPSPGHIAELQDLIAAEGITTVFSETLASPALAESLADDLGLTTAVLDPIEGLGDTTSGEDYLSLMRANLDALRAANRCA